MILVIVEGHSDAGFIEAVCEAVKVKCKARVARGVRPEKIRRLVKSYAKKSKKFRKVVVLIDEHMHGSKYLTNLVNSIRKELEQLGVQGKVIVVSKSIESWILAGYCEKSAESVPDPKKRLEDRLGGIVVKSYDAYYNLALKLDLDHAARISRGFQEFLQAIK